MPGAALLFGKQARILDGHSQLTGGRLHYLEVTGHKLRFPLRTQRRHHSGRLATQKNRHAAERSCRSRRHEIDPQLGPHLLQIALNQERLARSDDVLSKSVADLARTLGKRDAGFDLQLETNLIFHLEGDVEIAGVENLAEF